MLDTDNWVTIQITSVLMIIFFAMIAIGYILFMYTNVLNKQNGNLLESAHFKSPMLFLTFFSSIIIIAIVSNSSKIDIDGIYAIITIIVGLNVIIFGKTFEKIYKNMKQNEEKNKSEEQKLQEQKFKKLNENKESLLQKFFNAMFTPSLFGQIPISLLNLLIIEMFIIFAYKTTKNINSIIYGIVSAFLLLEYIWNERYTSLLRIFSTNEINSDKFLSRLLFFIFYLSSLAFIFSFGLTYSYSIPDI
jgi:hypothetical protein